MEFVHTKAQSRSQSRLLNAYVAEVVMFIADSRLRIAIACWMRRSRSGSPMGPLTWCFQSWMVTFCAAGAET